MLGAIAAEAYFGGVPDEIATLVLAALDDRLRRIVLPFRDRFGFGSA